MGSTKSKQIVDLIDRMQKRPFELTLEINSLRHTPRHDKRDIQELIGRLESLRDDMEADLLLVLQHCPA